MGCCLLPWYWLQRKRLLFTLAAMIAAILWYCLMGVAGIQLFFFLAFWIRIFHMQDLGDGIKHAAWVPPFASKPVSVIICAHNEALNLEKHIPAVLAQNYFFENGRIAFEVIVVLDACKDGSLAVLKAMQEVHPQLRILEIPEGQSRLFPGKKYPLSLGLEQALHEWIVCTDADCEPATRIWLHSMSAPLIQGKEIVAGYGAYRKTKGLLNAFIRYETIHTFLQYFCFTKAGMPYMAVGRNLACTKSLYRKAQSDPAWSALPSGDDDLLIQICGTPDNVGIPVFPGGFTWSAAKANLSDYLKQKQRHVSTGKYYQSRSKWLLGAYGFAMSAWWPLFLAYLVFGNDGSRHEWQVILPCLPLIFLIVWLQMGAAQLRERSAIPGWILFSFCWMAYNTVLAPWILWKSKQAWK